MFPAEPTAADLAAAQPLHPTATTGARTPARPTVTVGQAVRHAEMSTALREQRHLNTTDIEQWGLDTEQREAQALTERVRRNRPDELDHSLEQTLDEREDTHQLGLGIHV